MILPLGLPPKLFPRGKLCESMHVSVMGRDISGQFGILAPSGLEIWHLGHDLLTRLGVGACGSGVFSSFVLQRLAWLVAIAQGS